jgi:hypothetical protein
MKNSSLKSEIQRLRAGKAQLRLERMNASLEEKVQDLLRLQRLYVDIAGSQRSLSPRQRPWNLTSSVQGTLVITDNPNESPRSVGSFSGSQSHWVRPAQRWAVRT